MANMDYPAPCLSCSGSDCNVNTDAIRGDKDPGRQPVSFWNHLSQDENTRVVDNDPTWNVL